MKQFSLFASMCLVASLTGTVVAQMPDVPICVLSCTSQAASDAGCQSNMDLPCVCTNSAFASAATKCILGQCSAEEVNIASQLQKSVCAPYTSGSASPQASNTVAATGSSSATSSAAASTSTSTNANSASGNKQARMGLGLLTLGAGAALFAL